MYKYALILLVLASSCSSKDEKFCECLEAGEALNLETQKFFEEAPTAEDTKRIEELKSVKKEACKNYTTMSGDEMRKRQKECGVE